MHLVNGMGNSPSPGQPTPGVVKQDKSSGGSVGMTNTRSDPQRVGICEGGRPMGAAKGRQTDTMASCQPPPFPVCVCVCVCSTTYARPQWPTTSQMPVNGWVSAGNGECQISNGPYTKT